MLRIVVAAAAAIVLCSSLTGCGDGGKPKIEEIQAPPPNPMAEVKAILTNYTNGMPVSSEAASFDDLVKQVRAVDAAKADILEKGLKDLKANPQNPGPRAKELLKKL